MCATYRGFVTLTMMLVILPLRLGGEPASDISTLGFPESFQRTVPPEQEEDKTSDDLSDSTSLSEVNSLNFPPGLSVDTAEEENAIPRRVSRSSIMRLENILNGVSIGSDPRRRSRSLGRSPMQSQFQVSKILLPSICIDV